MNNFDIVIATFNGEKYIAEQLDSILSSNNFDSIVNKIIISDDNSTDSTREIIQKYINKYSFLELYINKGNNGVSGNFSNGLYISNADYIVLSDQDDIWLPNKLNILLIGIKNLENDSNGNTPCLFFTDLEVVDENLKIIDKSFFRLTKCEPDKYSQSNSVLLMNIVPGCSMVINKSLKDIALPIKNNNIYIYDWWFIIIAHFTGKIGFSKKATFQYRQHDKNAIGVSKKGFYLKVKELFSGLISLDDMFTISSDVYDRLLHHNYNNESTMLYDLLSMQNKSRFLTMLFMYKNGIKLYSSVRFNTIYRNARLMISITFGKNKG